MNLEEVRHNLSCPVASIRTLFTRNGDLDEKNIRNYLDFCIQAGSKTVMLTHGDSLFSTLTEKEIADLTRLVVEQTAGRAMVIAATDIWHTQKAIEFAEYCSDIGVDVLMALPCDWAGSCTCETVAQYYKAVSEHIPVMAVTNIFIPRGIDFGISTLKETLRIGAKVVAVKDDYGNDFARKMSLLVHDEMAVIAGGQKQHHLNMHHYGCDGYLSTFITFKPGIANKYWNFIQNDNYAAAKDIIRDYDMPYFGYAIKSKGGFDAIMHGVYELFKMGQRWRRKPYYSISDEEMDNLKQFLISKNIL